MKYIEPADLHDGRIRKVTQFVDQARVEVEVEAYEGNRFVIVFTEVLSVRAVRPEGMMLYALAEYSDTPNLRFELDDDDDDDAALEIQAANVTFIDL